MSKLIVELPPILHGQLKQQAAAEHKTLKVIVTILVEQYLRTPRPRVAKKATGFCGAWKDSRPPEAVIAELRAARRWRLHARQA